ncbi:helix-turn-helix domain-containing protein [Sphingobacterium phlebotomi]|uniref:Helix-turn-helix domain-containing protein n=1 Tax=Sphingobacterium phlebotomi TaxID=2605433 RepID=A0A5D4H7R8_9SPHI|nr:helix-turn-helix domain-containing protein [Sphingobacterium phlebotomi]TYR36342.1 helix-turn-helix domain-containing protein [Sphingobacterium phlebotomi]
MLERCLAELSQHLPTPSEEENVKREGNARPDRLPQEELITIKQAEGILGVSRWKIAKMREEGELTDYDRNGQIRLSRREVEAAKIWYSIPKGKV